jgi:hypothetical protein
MILPASACVARALLFLFVMEGEGRVEGDTLCAAALPVYDKEDAVTEKQRVQQVKDKMDAVQDDAAHRVDQFAERVRESTTSPAGQRAADAMEDMADKLKNTSPSELAHEGKERAQELMHEGKERVDQATTTVGQKMGDAAGFIREKAPSSGPMAEMAQKVAGGLEQSGSYLQVQSVDDMRSDLEGLVRRYPVQSLLVGLGIGYLLARATRR